MLRPGTDWARLAPWDTARLRLSTTLSKGLSGLGARTTADAAVSGVALARAGSRPDFSKIEAGLALDQQLPAGVQSRTLVRLQNAQHALPSAELFSLDGEDALSSFRAGGLQSPAYPCRRRIVASAARPRAVSAIVPGSGTGAGADRFVSVTMAEAVPDESSMLTPK